MGPSKDEIKNEGCVKAAETDSEIENEKQAMVKSEKSFQSESHKQQSLQRLKWNTLAYYFISFYAGISSITELSVSYYFKDHLKLEPASLAKISSLISLPWSLKPLLGLITDFIPVFGYKRKYYIIFCGFMAMICWICIYIFKPNLDMAVMTLFLINIATSFSSVLGEAIVVELSKDKSTLSRIPDEENNLSHSSTEQNDRAKDLISLFMIFKYSGMLIAAFLKGYLVESIGIHKVFIIGSILPFLIVLSGIIMKDTDIRIAKEESTITIKEMLAFVAQKHILVPLFFIIFFMSTPSYSDAYFYFLTNQLKFSATDLGHISFCSTVGLLLGIAVYKSYFKETSMKKLLIVCTIVAFLMTFTAYLLVLRINLKIGIKDFWFVLFSNSALSLIAEIMVLPLLSMACVLCPKNMEGTIFSVFMSAINFGAILSNLSGSFLTSYMKISSSDFSNLGDLILVSNLMNLLTIPILLLLKDSYFKH